VHAEGVWLNDEASFFLATESLLPNPLDQALPLGLDHLAGDGYLGLTTAIALLVGSADSNTFRVANAGLGAMVVILSMLIARKEFGARAGLVTGLVLAVWPTLVLWSATMLRDTLGSFALLVACWSLYRARDLGLARTLGAVFLSVVVLLSLRPYLGGALLVGVLAWAAYPYVRRLSRGNRVLLGGAIVALGVLILISQARRIDFAAHDLLYRQTVTRVETLGRLYTDTPGDATNRPIRLGAAVAMADPQSGWLLTGVVAEYPAWDQVRVAFTDESIRDVPISAVVLMQDAQIPPLQLIAWIGPNTMSFLTGTSMTSDSSNPSWVVSALVWDLLVLVALVACVRERISPSHWLFPLCVIGGTVLALVAIPGAPGNADRHRTTQTVPVLVVLASGLLSSSLLRARSTWREGAIVTTSSSNPPSAPTPAISRMRSAR
jgi:hypothetical protein